MLLRLVVKDLAIVASATVHPAAGLNVLSGETGAGKSVIASALALALGQRARSEVVRTGADKAVVVAEFQVDDRVRRLLLANGIPGDGPLRIERQVPGGVMVNGTRATVGLLRELAPLLVARTGQHDQRVLLDPERHVELLDAFAGLGPEPMASAWQALVDTRQHLAGLQRAASRRAERDELLGIWLGELDDLAWTAGQLAELVAERDVLRHADELRAGLAGLEQLLYAQDGAVVEHLGRADGELRQLAAIDPRLDEAAQGLARVLDGVDEVVREVRRAAERTEPDPERLEVVESRLEVARALARKHGCEPDELPDVRARLAAEKTRLGALEQDTRQARQAVADALSRAEKAAAKRTAERTRAGRRLDRELARALERLAMPRARIRTVVEPTDLGPGGADRVELLLSANPGEEPRPLARVASGGELSRVLLALSVLRAPDVGCFLFDEVDAGLGGRTAAALAGELRALSERVQVICISHQAAVASAADHHVAVAKSVLGGRTRTTVRALDAEGRVDELARMLGGDVGAEAARACATHWLHGWPERRLRSAG